MYLLLLLLFPFYDFLPSYDLAKSLQKIYDPPRKDYVIFIDYTKSINEERLYVIDMKTKETIIKSSVSHAHRSGKLYPILFSNKVGSKKSCVGAFLTLNSYYGKWGYSMRIKGLDPGINDNTQNRAIVFHPNVTDKTSWSAGCFTTPDSVNTKLINLVKNGCLVYVLN